MKTKFTIFLNIAIVTLAVLSVFMCRREVEHLKVQYDQELAIHALLTTSGHLRKYTMRDTEGRMFGISHRLRNPLSVVAAYFSGNWMLHADSHFYVIFPACAKDEPSFMAMLDDLRNPQAVLNEHDNIFWPVQSDARQYDISRRYFLGELDEYSKVNIVFKTCCGSSYTLSDGDTNVDGDAINVPVSSVVHNESLTRD